MELWWIEILWYLEVHSLREETISDTGDCSTHMYRVALLVTGYLPGEYSYIANNSINMMISPEFRVEGKVKNEQSDEKTTKKQTNQFHLPKYEMELGSHINSLSLLPHHLLVFIISDYQETQQPL